MAAIHVLVFALGLLLVAWTVASAMRTMVVPRAVISVLTRAVFLAVRYAFQLAGGRSPDYERRDRVMALYAPISLLALPVVWLSIAFVSYSGMYWALNVRPLRAAVTLSGSSMFTLGFAHAASMPVLALVLTEAALGIGLIALLITYLPSIYATFARREIQVALLETRAGSPPSGPKMIIRYHQIGWPGGFDDLWLSWQTWFADVEESHTSLPALVFFRSPHPDRSWVTAAGAVLDGASLVVSTVAGGRDPEAQLLIRSGYLSLQSIADYFGIAYDPDPAPDDPISVSRAEYDEVLAAMAEAGVLLRDDHDQTWRDFAGWRVNYDRVLVALAKLIDAPPAPWSSGRELRWTEHRPRLFRGIGRHRRG